MSIVVDRACQPRQIPAAQGGYFEWEGIAHFVTNDTSGTMDCPINHIASIQVTPIGGGGALTVNSERTLGTISATTVLDLVMPYGGTLTSAKIVGSGTLTASDANYWAYGLLNKSGTLTLADSSAAANTTKATGGTAMTADAVRSLTLLSATNLIFTSGQVLQATFTKTDTAPNLTGVSLLLTYTSTNTAAETLFVDMASAVADGQIPRATNGTITVSRTGLTLTSGLIFSFRVTGNY